MLESLRLDLSFSTEREAWAQQSRLAAFAREGAVKVIDAVFDEFDSPDLLLRIDGLQIDLGPMPPNADDSEWSSRLGERLRRSLYERLPAMHAAPAEADREPRISTDRNDLEELWYWLHTGVLPWQAPHDSTAIDALAARVLARQGAALVRALRESPAREQVLQRISEQWPLHLLARLAHAQSLEAGASVTMDAAAPLGSPRNGALLACATMPAAPTCVSSAAPASSAAACLQASLWQRWLRNVITARAACGAQGPAGADEPTKGAALPPLLHALLEEQLLLVEFADDRAWPALMSEDPRWVAAAFVRLGRSALWRRRCAQRLPRQKWEEALSLWLLPDDAAALSRVLERTELWALECAPSVGTPSSTPMPALLREWLLTHVLLDQEGATSTEDCIASLVARRARYDDLDVLAVAEQLRAGWSIALPEPVRSRMTLPLAAKPGHGPLQGATTPAPDSHRSLSQDLRPPEPPDWREALAPWLAAEDAAILAALLEQPARWGLHGSLDAAGLTSLLAQWLFGYLMFECGARSNAAECLTWLLDRRAALEGLERHAVARRLLESWPVEAAAQPIRSRLAAILAADPPVPGADGRREPPISAVPTGSVPALPPAQPQTELPGCRLPPAVRRSLAARLEASAASREWAAASSEGKRRTLLRYLLPDAAAAVLRTIDHPTGACHAAALPIAAERVDSFSWRFLMRELFEEGREFQVEGFIRRWLARAFAAIDEAAKAKTPVGPKTDIPSPSATPDTPFEHRINAALMSALRGAAASPLRPGPIPRSDPAAADGAAAKRVEPDGSAPAFSDSTPSPSDSTRALSEIAPAFRALAPVLRGIELAQPLYIRNAGLVLATPYLPRLFGRLGMLVDDRFASAEVAARGTLLLQFLVDGKCEAPEHTLPLNKLLCGIELCTPIGREIDLGANEREAIDGLLNAMIRNWPGIGHTSVAGLRAAFLSREGALTSRDDSWQLLVEPRSFDMLLDRIPWGFKTTKYPWMDRVLHADWR